MPCDKTIFQKSGHLAASGCLALLLMSGRMPARAEAPRVPQILAFGDSLTAGFGLPESEAFPAQLQARLAQAGIKAHVIDAGNSGDTTAHGLDRLDWSLSEKPDLVILELGANDMLRGIDPRIVRANLDAMIKKIKASGAKVLLAGMRAAPNWGKNYQKAFNQTYPRLAKTEGVDLYPFFLDGVALNPTLNQPDLDHPNAKGVAVIVDRILPYVVRLLQKPLLAKEPIGGRS